MKGLRLSPFWCVVILLGGLTGCTINRDIMFKTPTDHVFDTYQDTARRLRLQANDELQFRLFANDGFKMIDLVSEGAGREMQFLNRGTFTYFLEDDGLVKLPLLGRVDLAGMTIREAELFLETEFTQFYNRPYVQLRVLNRRVVVFPGGGGDAKIVPLENNNTTMLEVLATAGGLARRGNAHNVKLFRWDPATGKRQVFHFDLSDISGLKYADIVMQGDDVVYVQPNPDLAREALQDITPIISLLTSVLLIVGIARGFN